MKILHVQLAGPFTDGMGYQENIITEMHRNAGHDVLILTSRLTLEVGIGLKLTSPGNFATVSGIPYVRLPYVSFLPEKIARKIRLFSSYYRILEDFHPDIIFIHDIMFFPVQDIIRFAEKHPQTKICVDSHTDTINSAKTWFSRNILHKIVIRNISAKPLDPYVSRYWGTLPARMKFYQDFYNLSPSKISLLPMGLDDAGIDFSKRSEYREKIRKKYGINTTDFVILSGGKIDRRKRLSFLVDAVKQLKDPQIKLLLFGTPDKEMEDVYKSWLGIEGIICIGWIDYREIFQYCCAADVGVFPGTHSVLWEQTVGSATVGIFQKWNGFDHVNVNGNCLIRDFHSASEVADAIRELKDNPSLYAEMQKRSHEASKSFLYSRIAKESISL